MILSPQQDEIDDQPVAPPIVYKYVSAGRVDVLKNAKILFTPPVNTNDIFEVRQTFDMLYGPKAVGLMENELASADILEIMEDELANSPLAGISSEAISELYKYQTGHDIQTVVRSFVQETLTTTIIPSLNSSRTVNTLLENLGKNLICLSLSERFDISPMWAHYAANSTGFVIAFDTNRLIFPQGEQRERQLLYKVGYYDGRFQELLDNPVAALVSKQADWAYEREWRLYKKTDDIDADENGHHLVDFSRESVQRVIMGTRASDELISIVKRILGENYPGVIITKVRPDRSTASLIEEGI
jgi:hypothetical protein